MSLTNDDLIYAAFFFVDIVGLSNPILSTETQKMKLKVLTELISDCKTFVDSKKDDLLVLPTGDGMLLGFKNGLEQPLLLSIELHKKLKKHNLGSTRTEKIEVRIGCHVGHVFLVNDIYGNVNLWGPGSIIARRIMDMGDADHILLSNEIVDDLFELSDEYKKIIHLLHNFGIKHGDNLLIYSVYGDDFGNSQLPKEKIKLANQDLELSNNYICEKIMFDIILKDSQMMRFDKIYYFSNSTSEPIYEIIVNLITNSKEEFQELSLKALDENDHELEISKILASTPYSKKIILKLSKPIFQGDLRRYVKISYDSKLTKNTFEHIFLTESSLFELNFKHFANLNYSPLLYFIDTEQGSKNILEKSSVTIKGMFKVISWNLSSGITLRDAIRLEW